MGIGIEIGTETGIWIKIGTGIRTGIEIGTGTGARTGMRQYAMLTRH